MNSEQMGVLPMPVWGGKGVYCWPRCCVMSGLQCQPMLVLSQTDAGCRTAPPDGCTSWSTAGVSSNSRPHLGDGKRCVVKDGVTLHAVCCHAPSLECHLLENISADKDQVEVTCPSGWTLTDCGTVSQGSAVLGPVAKGNSCRVRGATGGAAGLAVCCRVRPAEQPVTAPQ
ncbi:proprotein convertase subtilisin/kexin type 9 isoform X1 [Lates japonicus]|uniref:Proprotein convertase subtilisin/kexin type 9 isoform X1 n=1 Tax=Lates japonicus TaxID=270547 RepID=A0AAD3N640_LATJO|nr:proprotein convertase subtilisin/kexin type 9 isoform X1 [Lates japonicus]